MKRKKDKQHGFKGESFSGEWEMKVNTEADGYEVKGPGGAHLNFPNFDLPTTKGTLTYLRDLVGERGHYGTVRFDLRADAVAAAMGLTSPLDHNWDGDCSCTQCMHYRKEAKAKQLLKDQPEIEI